MNRDRGVTVVAAVLASAMLAPRAVADANDAMPSSDGSPRHTGAYRIDPTPDGDLKIAASFVNFNRDPLEVLFALGGAVVKQAVSEYGYSHPDVVGLTTSCDGPCSQDEYDRKVLAYYESRALIPKQDGNAIRLQVNIPAVVKRNQGRLRGVAASFDTMARSRNYGPEETVGAIVSFVQTSLAYGRPPARENGREIIDFYVPPRALQAGTGDCDTKSALLASILGNFPGMKMIGIHVPKHYLVGIGRIPRPGEAFIEYDGAPYVLVEPSGPGWLPPGEVADTTQSALSTMHGVRVDPLY